MHGQTGIPKPKPREGGCLRPFPFQAFVYRPVWAFPSFVCLAFWCTGGCVSAFWGLCHCRAGPGGVPGEWRSGVSDEATGAGVQCLCPCRVVKERSQGDGGVGGKPQCKKSNYGCMHSQNGAESTFELGAVEILGWISPSAFKTAQTGNKTLPPPAQVYPPLPPCLPRHAQEWGKCGCTGVFVVVQPYQRQGGGMYLCSGQEFI